MIDVRDNWRILLLAVLCLLAALALFGPLGASGDDPFDDEFELREVVSSTTTDTDGAYSTGLPTGEYEVEVDALGYEPYSETVEIESDETTGFDIDLERTDSGTLEGTVTADGDSVSGVELSVINEENTTVTSADTAADGSYEVALPTGEYEVVIEDPLYEAFSEPVTIATDETTSLDVDLSTLDSGTLEGTVTADGDSVSDLELSFVDGGVTVASTDTEADGSYEVVLPTGEYEVVIEEPLYEAFSEPVTIATDETTSLDVDLSTLDSGTLEGTVTADDDPVSDVDIAITDGESGELVDTLSPESDGSYQIELPEGSYEVAIDDILYAPVTETVEVDTDQTQTFDIELDAVPSGAIEGAVTADGQPVSDVEIDFVDVDQGFDDAETFSDPTNLQYGLELSGGARIRGQLVGMTAEDAGITQDNQPGMESELASILDVDPIDVRVRLTEDTVELYTDNRTETEFANALGEVGLDVTEDDIRRGVTADTRGQAVDTLTDRLDQTGLSGANVGEVSDVTGGHFIVAEAPGISLAQLREIASEAGRVQVIAGYPEDLQTGEGLQTEEILVGEDFATIIGAEPADAEGPDRVPVTLTPEAGAEFQEFMIDQEYTGNGIGRCHWSADEFDGPAEGQWCLYTVVDGEYIFGASMGADLAQTLNADPTWSENPRFRLTTSSFSEAQMLEINLRAGALPTELDIQSETFISPSLAQLFKPLALLTALMAWLAVCAVVYYWYRDIRVAIPMLLTASSEVFLLLGFAAAIGMALDLSHIAGFIAVIGTGLDDLIIMADEILQRKKDVKTGRVFQSRFRKAFWIIGMAAATTIIAMSPLAVLSLGDLQGFAIITIVGVLIGVGITRPAYGDVLRHLMLDDVKRK